jgi:hypothetical protein
VEAFAALGQRSSITAGRVGLMATDEGSIHIHPDARHAYLNA